METETSITNDNMGT